MVEQVTPITSQQQPIVQGAGSWVNYIGPGASNLTDPARVSALTSAGLGMMASFQNPAVYDAIQERQKYVESFTNPLITAGLSATNLANIPLADIASRYGPNVANATQSYFTANPTQKAMDIVNAYGVQSTNIIGSSGIQRYIGTTIDKGYAIYSEAGGVNPFRANVLTEYQQGAVGNIANDVISGKFAESGIQGLSNALVGIRGIESGAGLIVSDFTSRFATPTIQEPTPIAQPAQIAPQSQGNFITDFFGGFAKSGYAAGAGAIQPFAGSQQYTPIYESLMAKPTEERLTGSKVKYQHKCNRLW